MVNPWLPRMFLAVVESKVRGMRMLEQPVHYLPLAVLQRGTHGTAPDGGGTTGSENIMKHGVLYIYIYMILGPKQTTNCCNGTNDQGFRAYIFDTNYR